MRQSISIDFQNYNEVMKGLKDCQKELAMGVRRTELDLAKRGVHTVVRNEVTKVYNIKKKDVSSESSHHYTETGSVSLAGVSIPFFNVEYTGRMLTPVHFQMTPRQRPGGNRKYTVMWKPFRGGGKEPLTSESGQPPFIYGGLPFARLGARRYPIDVIKRLSVPIMIENDKVSPQIEEEISRRIEQGLARYIK